MWMAGDGEELEGVRGEGTIIRTYCTGKKEKKQFSIKEKEFNACISFETQTTGHLCK